MKVAAIIAEYNPFHEGHQYQIEETKKRTGADYVLVLMSGDFVQRGEPAIFSKQERCYQALLGGADVILELPTLYATSSAEFFAGGAVTILDQLGVVDFLSFGSECGEIAPFFAAASCLLEQATTLESKIASFLKEGFSYPSAREKALAHFDYVGSDLLSSPNNILGVEYCKALQLLNSSILPVTILRKGMGYHEISERAARFPSASSLRKQITASSDLQYLTANDFSLLLQYQLLKEKDDGFADYLDCSASLSHKLQNALPSASSFDELCSHLKTKDLTYTRIRRVLLHILLGLKEEPAFSLPLLNRKLPVDYVRLLGFRKAASPLLSKIKKNTSIPMIVKLADAKDQLAGAALSRLEQDIAAANLYHLVFASKYKKELLNEYQQSPVILK